jgi:hypothetical protein
MPNDFSLIINPSASFGKFDSDYKYIVGDSEVINNTDEDAWSADISTSLSKSIKNNTFTISLIGGAEGNDMEYKGTTPSTVDAKYYYGGVRPSAFFKLGKITLQPSVNFYIDRNVFNGKGYTRYNPKYFITAGYFINPKNRINFSSEMYYMTPSISQMGSNIQIQNQIEAITGNPLLKSEIVNISQISYACTAHRHLSLNAYCSYSHNARLLTSSYQPLSENGHNYMLRTLQNNGFRNSYKYGLAATSRLVNSALSLRAGIEGNSVIQHGEATYHITSLSYNAQASYSVSNVYFTATYLSKEKSMMTWGTIEKPQYYYFSFGWKFKNFSLQAFAIAPFNSGYSGNVQRIWSESRTSVKRAHTASFHRSFEIDITYSFSYGKKLSSIPQVTTPSAVKSGILQ